MELALRQLWPPKGGLSFTQPAARGDARFQVPEHIIALAELPSSQDSTMDQVVDTMLKVNPYPTKPTTPTALWRQVMTKLKAIHAVPTSASH
jgi:hypothetical protein